ncbi:MAG: cupin domain-containing protein [Anaerostipes hadrus]
MKSKELKIEEGNHAVVEPQIMQYPLTYFKQKLSKETYEMIDWHWHSGVQFCYVTLGEVKIQIAGNEVILEEGEGLFINAQQVHKAINQKECRIHFIKFANTFMGLEGSEMYHQFMEPVLHAKGAEIIVIRKNDEKCKDC